MTRDQIVLRLQQDYAARREENHRVFEERVHAACDKCPGLREVIAARQEALMAGIRRGILSPSKDTHANDSLSSRLAEYNERIAQALQKGGLSQDALQPVYGCPTCRDEGYLYEPSRHMCACFESELNRRMMAELGLNQAQPQTFEAFDETLFSCEPLPQSGVSQRQMMIRNRNSCLQYADSFPDTPKRDMLLIGHSGLGKTYLLQAIAHRVAQRGFLPLYTSAYHFFEVARKAQFDNTAEPMNELLGAPLLLIDDLGTEPLFNNITVTQFFNLLNERQNAGLHTVISTNLSWADLRERYTERVTSRLLDTRNCEQLIFIGEDIRRKLGKSEGQA